MPWLFSLNGLNNYACCPMPVANAEFLRCWLCQSAHLWRGGQATPGATTVQTVPSGRTHGTTRAAYKNKRNCIHIWFYVNLDLGCLSYLFRLGCSRWIRSGGAMQNSLTQSCSRLFVQFFINKKPTICQGNTICNIGPYVIPYLLKHVMLHTKYSTLYLKSAMPPTQYLPAST